jgi:hypothetical protein
MPEPVIHKTTPEEAARIRHLAELAERDGADILERFRLHQSAAEKPTFVGTILRAINESEVDVLDLAEFAGVDLATFDDFRCGRIALAPDTFERVARRLGFVLVRKGELVGT